MLQCSVHCRIAEQALTRNAAGASRHNGGKPADTELEQRVRSVSNNFADNVHIFANEPTLACYRLQEHVRRSLGGCVDKRCALAKNDIALEGRVFDLDYDIKAVKDIYPAEARFRSIQEMLKNAIYMKQQLDRNRMAREKEAEAAKEREKEERKLKRFSASFDAQNQHGKTMSSSASSGDMRTSPIVINPPTVERAASLRNSPRERSGSVQSTGSYKSTLCRGGNTPTK